MTMHQNQKFKAVILGAAGMTGGELLRILARHSQISVTAAISKSKRGTPIGVTHPHLRSYFQGMNFVSYDEAPINEADIAFVALPHGSSANEVAKLLEAGLKVVDLSADFRLNDPEVYRHWYGLDHPRPDLLESAAYGLPELNRSKIISANLTSGVGCNATASILAILPLARAGLIESVHLDVRAGSSEAGARPSTGSHHPFRSRSARIVEPFSHRHLAEVSQELELPLEKLSMRLSTMEAVRGVQACADVTLNTKLSEKELWKIYRTTYSVEPFVELCPARPSHLRFPDPKLVWGSNKALVGFALKDDIHCLVVSAIDNLMKGAAGSAVQSANLMLGIPETEGLEMQPVYPA
ncbi:MAG: LysW-gamma-L-alpha-aminoadipyl-6-phosphate/LysW-L-glutamyl-5-phosphate reductase [Thermovirga sp.]|nr:LysW-gamma-L-alpha-aminoadipyl-6-phosphate/LysW-L-glutamyl-5-phosphate reductase [Thermovirga sp.]